MPVRKTRSGTFPAGISGNPLGRPTNAQRADALFAEFVNDPENAKLILSCLLKHAIENPTACVEVAKMFFGSGRSSHDTPPLPGPLDSLDDCLFSEYRAIHERAYGRLSEAKFRAVIHRIESRRDELAAAETADPPELHGSPELEPGSPPDAL